MKSYRCSSKNNNILMSCYRFEGNLRININADIMDRAKNKFFFILVFFKLSIFITLLNYCFYLILTSLQVHNSSALRLMRLAL